MQSLLEKLRNLFNGDRREQILLAGVAGFGVLLAILALTFFSGGDGDNGVPADDGSEATATATTDDDGTASATNTRSATATRTPTATPTIDPDATATADPDATETPSGDANQGSDGSGSNPATATSAPAATATPVPPTAPPSSNLGYCNTSGESSLPAGTVIGLVTIGGVAAPAGTTVTLAFDGVAGPSETVVVEDGRAGYSFNYPSGGTDCANQAGAAISVIVNGQSFETGASVGDGTLLVVFNVALN